MKTDLISSHRSPTHSKGLLAVVAKLCRSGALCLGVVVAPTQAFGQINASANTGTGNWGVPATWSGGVVPHNGGSSNYNVTIGGGSTVNLNLARTINQLNLDFGGTLNFNNGFALTIQNNGQTGAGVITNNGSINLNSTASNTFLQFTPVSGNTGFQLNGNGVLTMSSNSSTPTAFITGTSALLTHGNSHTIQGNGRVGSNLLATINSGTILARNGENMEIQSANTAVDGVFFRNNGLIVAQSGGTVTLTGAGQYTGSGSYRAESGGTVVLEGNINLADGLLNGAGQFTLLPGSHTWQSVNHSSNSTVQNGATLSLTNNLTNSGNIQIAGSGSITRLRVNTGNTTLSGGGTIRMSGSNAGISGATNSTLTNFNNTISGNGGLGLGSLEIINQGTIQAGAGEVMNVDTRVEQANPNIVTFTNSPGGLVRAFNGGRIVFNGVAGAIGGNGTYRAEANSTIEFLANSKVFGGVYETVGTGRILSSGNTTLNNITNNGNLSIGNGTTATVSGPVINNGNISVASTGSQTNVSVQGTQTISGTGSLTLAGGNSNITGTGTVTNGAGHTINGGGSIGSNTLAVTNAGTITNSPGSSMTVGGSVQNTGTIAVQQGAVPNLPTFSFVGPFANSSSGTFFNNVGSSVNFGGSFSNAGTVNVRPTTNNTPAINFGGTVNQTDGGLVLFNGALVRSTSNSVPSFWGGFLAGVGTVQASNTWFGGTASFRPGFSPGQLNFDGDLTWGNGGVIEFDLGIDALNSDFIAITGDLLKDGTGTYAFTFLENGIVLNQTYDLMSFDTTTFALNDFSFTNGGGFAGNFSFNGSNNRLQFTVTAIPEPGTASVLAAAGLLLLTRRRRV